MRRRLRKGGDSINSFMAWVGGKKALRDEILARFPRNYKRYIEVFGGAGWVLFHKPPGNDFEVFNDFNGNLVNLYRCVREQPEALRNELRYMLNSRLDFEYMKGMLHSQAVLPDVRRAAYYNADQYYEAVSSDGFDHAGLADALLGIKGKFLLSYNDCPEIRALYDRPGIVVEGISRLSNIAQRYENGKQYPELLISNYDTTELARSCVQLTLFDRLDSQEILNERILYHEI